MAAKKDYIFTVGRRKRSIARVRLFSGRGESVVNGKSAAEYFSSVAAGGLWTLPFEITKTAGKHWVSVKVAGGGKTGQLESTIHGIARGLVKLDDGHRVSLKTQGLLTRDARKKQRRHVGTGGKARRQKSSPKR